MAAIQDLVLTFCPEMRCAPHKKLKTLDACITVAGTKKIIVITAMATTITLHDGNPNPLGSRIIFDIRLLLVMTNVLTTRAKVIFKDK